LIAWIDGLRAQGAETALVEFKQGNADPEKIGVLVSAIANAARLAGERCGHVVWGIQDQGHNVIGTGFDPSATVVQKQPLEFWLTQRLKPDILLRFEVVAHPAGRVVVLEVPAAAGGPMEFDGVAYIRIGSATPKLSSYPERQRALWDRLREFYWETAVAMPSLTSRRVWDLLDPVPYFQLSNHPVPERVDLIEERFVADGLLLRDLGDRWSITNLGAILFARSLSAFESRLARKAVRLVAYDGKSRADMVTHRADGVGGYTKSFVEILSLMERLLPQNEVIDGALRQGRPSYPPIALRELLANALIHQDMTITGAGPLVELFTDRIEISNPGKPLVSPDRFIDFAPRSRNEMLAALMRRMRFCEEQGSGVDKVVAAVELFQLPPPEFREEQESLRTILYARRRFAAMTVD
jgi:predicted HTH transcriptional regulator